MKKIHKKIDKINLKRVLARIITILVLLLICAIPPIFLNNAFGYLPLLTLFFTVLFAFIYLLVLKRSIIYIENSYLSNCVRDSDIKFTITLKNRSLLIFTKVNASFFVSDLFGNIDSISQYTFTLAPKEQRDFSFDVKFAHIGTYTTGLKEMQIYDPLSLFYFTLKDSKTYEITVVPKLYDYRSLAITNQIETESQRSLIATSFDGMDYTGVREYVVGDPIKNIHWKLSAHSSTYLTKQMETYGNNNINIILDFITTKASPEVMMTLFDGIIETGISLAKYAKDIGVDCNITYENKNGNKKVVSMHTFDNLYDLISDFPKISPIGRSNPAPDYIKDEIQALYGAGNVIYCTSQLNEEIIEHLISLKMKRRHALLFVLVQSQMNELEKTLFLKPVRALEEYNIPFYILESAEDFVMGAVNI